MLPLGNWKPWETVGPQGLTITEIVRDKEFVEWYHHRILQFLGSLFSFLSRVVKEKTP